MRNPTLSLVLLLAGVAVVEAADDWRPLLNGKNLDGWETFMDTPHKTWDVPGLKRDAGGKYLEKIGLNRDPLNVFTIETVDGRPALHVSGQGFGVVATKETFGNFHLRMQVKWGEKKWAPRLNAVRDCGLLYFCHGEQGFDHGTWPRSIEFQIQEHDMGDLWAISAQVTVKARRKDDSPRTLYLYDPQGEPTLFVPQGPAGNRCVKLGDPEKPKGEWNTLDLFCVGGDSIHVVNGVVVMRLHNAERVDGATPAPLTSGAIALQTEGAEVYYRDVEIRSITELPAL
jgi:hypothetical protein